MKKEENKEERMKKEKYNRDEMRIRAQLGSRNGGGSIPNSARKISRSQKWRHWAFNTAHELN